MTDNERMAIAMLRSGASFREAADATGVPIDRVREIWSRSSVPAAQ